MLVRIKRYLPILTLILLSLLFYYKLAFTDLILARGDTYAYFYPYWEARDAAIQTANLPIWTNNIFMGVPLLANPQLGTFYLPNLLGISLAVPDAISMSIVLHVVWASIGVFVLFRQTISQSIIPALIAAIVFGLSGYVSAHVEQINQLQGIAWLPWLFYLFHKLRQGDKPLKYTILLSIAWATQIFSGHTQTVFMTGIALGIFALFPVDNQRISVKKIGQNVVLLALSAIFSILLAMPQLLPTLELTGMSNRGSGFDANQATAFSLPPTYLGRALLPSYDGQLFTEFTSYIGIIALGLALYGAFTSSRKYPLRWCWITLAAIGLIFAMGRYTFIYLYIAELPGFNLFRVPARWLALYALGMSMLSGYGLLVLQERGVQWLKAVIVAALLVSLMIIGRVFAPIPVHIVGSALPTTLTLSLWAIGLILLFGIFTFPKRTYTATIALIVIVLELFLSAQVLPYNDLVPRDVYLGQRFTISQMLALSDDQVAPSRMLAISERLFDVGDVATLQNRYETIGLDFVAQQTAFTALKSQEILFPNLGLTWHIPTIDGYGGGILPTIYYSQFTSLLLPDNSLRTTDGRIGEMIANPECRGACVPDLSWLRLTNVDYIITDKNFDVPHNGIFYDTTLSEFWSEMPPEPNFVFDDVQVLLSNEISDFASESFQFRDQIYYLAAVNWVDLESLITNHSDLILGVTVVNSRTNTFVQLTPVGFERVLSSDIKVYRLETSSRVRLASDIAITADDWDGHEEALLILQNSPETLIIHDAPQLSGTTSGSAEITNYTDTHIEISVTSDAETYLYLADAYYPGWQAQVNGEAVPVYRANVMFRAVPVPAGDSTIVFEFVPRLWYGAIIFGGIMWIAAILLLLGLNLRKDIQEE